MCLLHFFFKCLHAAIRTLFLDVNIIHLIANLIKTRKNVVS